MQLTCPKCGQVIPGNDINVERGVGVCKACSEVVPLTAAPSAPPPKPLGFAWTEENSPGAFRVSQDDESSARRKGRNAMLFNVTVGALGAGLGVAVATHPKFSLLFRASTVVALALAWCISTWLTLRAVRRSSWLSYNAGVVRCFISWTARKVEIADVVAFERVRPRPSEDYLTIAARVGSGDAVPLEMRFYSDEETEYAVHRLNELLNSARIPKTFSGYRVAGSAASSAAEEPLSAEPSTKQRGV